MGRMGRMQKFSVFVPLPFFLSLYYFLLLIFTFIIEKIIKKKRWGGWGG